MLAMFSFVLSVPRPPPTRPLQWLDLTEGRLRLDRLCRNGAVRLSSPDGSAVIPRETRKPPAAILRCAAARKRVRRRSPPALRSPSRPRWARARKQRPRRTYMANIGTFKKTGNDYQRRNRHPQRPDQERPHRPRGQPRRTTTPPATASSSAAPRSAPPGPSAPPRAATISRPQARRSELHRADLRQPLRRRGRREPSPSSGRAAARRNGDEDSGHPARPAGRGFRFARDPKTMARQCCCRRRRRNPRSKGRPASRQAPVRRARGSAA